MGPENIQLSAGDVLYVPKSIDVIATPQDQVLARIGGATLQLGPASADQARAVLRRFDGERTFGEVCKGLDEEASRFVPFVKRLVELGVLARRCASAPSAAARVLVVGGGRLAIYLVDLLIADGLLVERLVAGEGFASCEAPAFARRQEGARITSAPVLEPRRRDEAPLTIEALTQRCGAVSAVVCALEAVPYRAVLDINAACLSARRPCLFVTPRPDGAVMLGPTLIPGQSSCFACLGLGLELATLSDRAAGQDILEHFRVGTLSVTSPAPVSIGGDVLKEVRALLSTGVIMWSGAVETVQLRQRGKRSCARLADCPACRSVEVDERSVLAAKALVSQQDPVTQSVAPQPTEYRTVCVLGGGTAGYLAALALRALLPKLSITLIESSKIPIIGVGEATTSELPPFLHRILGIDPVEFFRKVLPTFKLGIRFDWGRPAPYRFYYPFDRGSPLEGHLYEGDIRHVTLLSSMMEAGKIHILDGASDGPDSLLPAYPFAYHLDNKRFVRFLAERAHEVGIEYLDREIVDAGLSSDGENIDHLITAEGERLTYDLYIDCTGFRSFLLEKKLGSPFISYADSLFTDTAVVASVPHGGVIGPYTLAETMDAGWCWNIPQMEENHRGYVFASEFLSRDQAEAEMRRKNAGMGDAWMVRFRSGRHEHFWRGNVVAIGNSYGFVEPLESTAIQVVLREALLLASNFPRFKNEASVKDGLNQAVGSYWDYICGFLSIHYRYNQRLDTDFWKACRERVEVSRALPVLARYREGAPLVHRPMRSKLLNFNEFGHDMLLMGQDVAPERYLEPRETRAQHAARLRSVKLLVDRAFPHLEGLELLQRRPDLIEALVNDRDGWMISFERYLRNVYK